eukprot:440841-Pyramimonas_sp.AAC.1
MWRTLRSAIDQVQRARRSMCNAMYGVQSMRGFLVMRNACGATYATQPMWCNRCGAIYVAHCGATYVVQCVRYSPRTALHAAHSMRSYL